MRIVPAVFALVLFIVPSQVQADSGYDKYERKSEGERTEWITRLINQSHPDMDAERKERLVPNVLECLDMTGDIVPFDMATEVCIETGAEEVQ